MTRGAILPDFDRPASRILRLTEELVCFGQGKPGRVLREVAQPEGVPRSEDDQYLAFCFSGSTSRENGNTKKAFALLGDFGSWGGWKTIIDISSTAPEQPGEAGPHLGIGVTYR